MEKIRYEEAESNKTRMKKQAELRKEFMLLNAQIRDSKKLEEEMNNIELLQVCSPCCTYVYVELKYRRVHNGS